MSTKPKGTEKLPNVGNLQDALVAARDTPDRQSREQRRLVAAREAINRMCGERSES
jgi:hypothetical protein